MAATNAAGHELSCVLAVLPGLNCSRATPQQRRDNTGPVQGGTAAAPLSSQPLSKLHSSLLSWQSSGFLQQHNNTAAEQRQHRRRCSCLLVPAPPAQQLPSALAMLFGTSRTTAALSEDQLQQRASAGSAVPATVFQPPNLSAPRCACLQCCRARAPLCTGSAAPGTSSSTAKSQSRRESTCRRHSQCL